MPFILTYITKLGFQEEPSCKVTPERKRRLSREENQGSRCRRASRPLRTGAAPQAGTRGACRSGAERLLEAGPRGGHPEASPPPSCFRGRQRVRRAGWTQFPNTLPKHLTTDSPLTLVSPAFKLFMPLPVSEWIFKHEAGYFLTSYIQHFFFFLSWQMSAFKNHSCAPELFKPRLPGVLPEGARAQEDVISRAGLPEMTNLPQGTGNSRRPAAHSRWSVLNGTKDRWQHSFSSLNVFHFISLFIWDYAHWNSNVSF